MDTFVLCIFSLHYPYAYPCSISIFFDFCIASDHYARVELDGIIKLARVPKREARI